MAVEVGADRGIVADGSHVQQVLELTGGHGAEAVLDFVGEGGATKEGVAMLRRAGNYFVVGYGENIDVPTIDIISTEINFIGNLVGSYNDLQELMAWRKGKSHCTPRRTRWRTSSKPSTISTRAGCADARSSSPEYPRLIEPPTKGSRTMAKELRYNTEARLRLEQGVNALADAVKVTLGSKRPQCRPGEAHRTAHDHQRRRDHRAGNPTARPVRQHGRTVGQGSRHEDQRAGG